MGRYMAPIIKQKIEEQGEEYRERANTIHTRCPRCDRNDKFSILKENGSCICYRGSCDFGTQWFEVWLSETAGISLKEARSQIYGPPRAQSVSNQIGDPFIKTQKERAEDPFLPIDWPPTFIGGKGTEESMWMDEPQAKDGLQYIESRGIPLQIANKLSLQYFPKSRRVVFPVLKDGVCFGWQARTIDSDVSPKILTSPGFKRANMVMFADQIKRDDFVIICEGPVDAIKFFCVGGAVCTMGKTVTAKQIEFILSYNPKKIYLALDPDAAEEMNKIFAVVDVPVYIIEIPDSCINRCKLNNKKPDFGECSFRECYIAWGEAKPMATQIVQYIKPVFHNQ